MASAASSLAVCAATVAGVARPEKRSTATVREGSESSVTRGSSGRGAVASVMPAGRKKRMIQARPEPAPGAALCATGAVMAIFSEAACVATALLPIAAWRRLRPKM